MDPDIAAYMIPAPDAFILLRLRWTQLRRAMPAYGLVLIAIGYTCWKREHSRAPSHAGRLTDLKKRSSPIWTRAHKPW